MGLAIRFALSQPGVAAVIPPSFLDLLDKAIVAAKQFRPITAAEVDRLRASAIVRVAFPEGGGPGELASGTAARCFPTVPTRVVADVSPGVLSIFD